MDFDFQKIVQILAYLALKEGGKINYTKALKIIFFADKLYLRRFGTTITSDEYSALKRGPVASNTYNIIKSPDEFDQEYITKYFTKSNYNIELISEPDLDFLAKKEKEALDETFDFFGSFDYKDLIEKTHKYEEWKIHEEVVKNGNARSMNIEDFFKNSIGQDSIFDMPQEDIDMAKSFYQERLSYV